MHKRLFAFVAVLALLTMVLAACSVHEASGPTGPAVHMGGADFLTHSITIHKGDSLTLIDDSSVAHTIANGTWGEGGKAQPGKESGAPAVNVNFTGGDNSSVGPFTTAGTFKLYCTIHPGMNLTVVVQ